MLTLVPRYRCANAPTKFLCQLPLLRYGSNTSDDRFTSHEEAIALILTAAIPEKGDRFFTACDRITIYMFPSP